MAKWACIDKLLLVYNIKPDGCNDVLYLVGIASYMRLLYFAVEGFFEKLFLIIIQHF